MQGESASIRAVFNELLGSPCGSAGDRVTWKYGPVRVELQERNGTCVLWFDGPREWFDAVGGMRFSEVGSAGQAVMLLSKVLAASGTGEPRRSPNGSQPADPPPA